MSALLVLVLLPYAILGLLVAALPLLVVIIVSRLPIAPAVRATVVPGVAFLSFVVVWVMFSWQSLRDDGWNLGLAAVILFPFLVAALFLVVERASSLWRRWRGWHRPRGTSLQNLQGMRQRVSAEAWEAL